MSNAEQQCRKGRGEEGKDAEGSEMRAEGKWEVGQRESEGMQRGRKRDVKGRKRQKGKEGECSDRRVYEEGKWRMVREAMGIEGKGNGLKSEEEEVQNRKDRSKGED